jgi:hypothetical protein
MTIACLAISAFLVVWKKKQVTVKKFDGRSIPCGDGNFDVVIFIDVLHRTDDPMILLQEAVRVARQVIVMKNHLLKGALAYSTLRLMDWVGNA